MANNDMLKGIFLGIAIAGLAPVVLSAIGGRRDTVGKGLARAGSIFIEKTRETVAELGEVVEDVAADLQAEETSLDDQPSTDTDPPQTAAGGTG